jgi:hypothetical protein
MGAAKFPLLRTNATPDALAFATTSLLVAARPQLRERKAKWAKPRIRGELRAARAIDSTAFPTDGLIAIAHPCL